MKCERCPTTKNLLRFYDELNGGACSLCDKCFRWFANGRRKGGLPEFFGVVAALYLFL